MRTLLFICLNDWLKPSSMCTLSDFSHVRRVTKRKLLETMLVSIDPEKKNHYRICGFLSSICCISLRMVSLQPQSGSGALVVQDEEDLVANKVPLNGYHAGGNNYCFDALQAYCFGMNLKL